MTKPGARPFIAIFAMPIARAKSQTLRYDAYRQLSQVRVGETWMDAAIASPVAEGLTRFTKVERETTDDA